MTDSEYHQVVDNVPVLEQSPQKDENGEEIVLEGMCDRNALYNQICLTHFSKAFLVGACLSPLTFYRAAKIWKLYLTRTSIHYSRLGAFWTKSNFDIPFEDIDNITLADATTIYIRMDRATLLKHLHWCFVPIFGNAFIFSIDAVANAQEFVDAVKREMATRNCN